MTPAMRHLILRGGSTDEIKELAIEEGMLTLRMDGMKKVEQGVTSLEEVLKETAA